MKLEVLMSCMHQNGPRIIEDSHLEGHVAVINQCDKEEYQEYPTKNGVARMFSTTQRGLTKSRNMAIQKSDADICMLCDDDEIFVPDYETKIRQAYEEIDAADVIIFKLANLPPSFPDQVMRLRFPKTMKVCSCQISFKRKSLMDTGVGFDELLGAGTGNGAEEELKFLLDCERAGLRIYYVPTVVASVAQEQSTWFSGFDERFFENRGATTRYILGLPVSIAYAVYYVIKKRNKYKENLTLRQAFWATWRGIMKNRIGKQSAANRK